jgi:hypothetical protein
MQRKNFAATGSFIAEDRPRALDLLGFSSQLIFNTFHNGRLHDSSTGRRRAGLRRGTGPQPGHARVLLGRPRLLPSCYVPLVDPRRRWPPPRTHWPRARPPSRGLGLPARFSPSHTDLFGVWARAEEAGHPDRLPRRRHRGPHRPGYFVNGLPIPHDFHGGDENFRSVDYMGIPVPPAQTLATLIFDGVLERFPDLRIGVIEQGAIWVPSWLRQMESAFEAFHRHEERLQACRCARATTCTARSASRPTRPRTWAGSSSRAARSGAVLVGLPARGGRAQAASSASRPRSATPTTTCASSSTSTTSSS